MSKLAFEVTETLERLHQKPDFGLRIQALFAHALLRLGWVVREVKSSDHPDITAEAGQTKLKFEIEVLSIPYQVKEDDVKALRPKIGWGGYLALLDCGPPLCWFLLPYDAIKKQVSKSLHKPEIKRLSEPQFSKKCSEVFCSLLYENKERLENLTFPLLKEWAVNGKVI